jgi:hypothetical protein
MYIYSEMTNETHGLDLETLTLEVDIKGDNPH